MNVCFLIGKIVSKIKFDFILNGKNISIVRFDMELENCNKIEVVGYDQVADFYYSKLVQGDFIGILGHITTHGKIIVEEIEIE